MQSFNTISSNKLHFEIIISRWLKVYKHFCHMIHYHWVKKRLREGFSHWVYTSKLNVSSADLLRPNSKGGLCPHCCPFLLSKPKWLLPNHLFGVVDLCYLLSCAWKVCIEQSDYPDLNGTKTILKIKPSGEGSSHVWK